MPAKHNYLVLTASNSMDVAGALGAALGHSEGRTRAVVVGAAKASVGHTEAPSGQAGLLRAVEGHADELRVDTSLRHGALRVQLRPDVGLVAQHALVRMDQPLPLQSIL